MTLLETQSNEMALKTSKFATTSRASHRPVREIGHGTAGKLLANVETCRHHMHERVVRQQGEAYDLNEAE